ncbi:MAG: hypothetical protein KAU22_09835 [Desulfuromonadales bacterium]|nr:hypothetical protein [Desulfuromonadales bacterium]
MELWDRLELATETLQQQNRQLRAANAALLIEQKQWGEERAHILAEIDRILKRLDDVPLEQS